MEKEGGGKKHLTIFIEKKRDEVQILMARGASF